MEGELDPFAAPDYGDMLTDDNAIAPRASVNQDTALTSYADYEEALHEEEDNGYTPIDLTDIARREMERLGVDHGMFLSWRNLSYYTKNVRLSLPMGTRGTRRLASADGSVLAGGLLFASHVREQPLSPGYLLEAPAPGEGEAA